MAKMWKKEGKRELVELTPETFKITQPSIIYLSGWLTLDSTPHHIKSCMSAIEELIEDRPETPLYLWSNTSLADAFKAAAYCARPQKSYSKDIVKLTDMLIKPLVSANDKPLPFVDAQKNLRNLTLFGYSMGTVSAQALFNASLKMMTKIGYTEKETRTLLREVALISAGNASLPAREGNRFTTVYLAASNDLPVRIKNRIFAPLRTLFNKKAKELTITPVSKTGLEISAKISGKWWEWVTGKSGRKHKRAISPLIPKWTGINCHHELAHYITLDEEHSPFANIARQALLNGLSRKNGPLRPSHLIEPAPNAPTHYANKIWTARLRRA